VNNSLTHCENIERKQLIKYCITYLTHRDMAVIQADYAAYDSPTLIGSHRPDVIGRTCKLRYVIGLTRTDRQDLWSDSSQTQIESFALAALDHPEIERFYLFVPSACRPEALRLLRSQGVSGRHVEVVGVSLAVPRLLHFPAAANC
jgi:hypothetical protein